MTTERYHDVVNEDVLGIAFLASNSIIDYSFLWWTKYHIVPDVSYWWNQFDRCCVERHMLFSDVGQRNKFSEVSEAYGIDPAACDVCPPSLYDSYVQFHHVRIIHDVTVEEASLSIMYTHFSKPEST